MNRETGRNTVHYPLPLKAAVLALALSAAMAPSRVRAADITVDAGGTCTLAEAITSANNDSAASNGCVNSSGTDTITLEKDVILAATLPDITTEITIEGAGHKIDGNNDAAVGTVLRIDSGGNLILNEATLTGGTWNGISSYSSVTVNNSTISGNTGNGISSSCAPVTVTNSTISGNTGNGIYADQSLVTVTNSTVSGNTGSGITAGPFADIIVTNSTISGNSRSGIFSSDDSSYSSVTVTNSTISGNTGSGIYSSSSVTLKNSLISGNTNSSSANEIYSTGIGSTVTAAAGNVFGHSGETNAQAFGGFTPGASDVNATSDGTNPMPLGSIIGSLMPNGGPTLTHALPAVSPAIDLDPTCGTGLTEDQRGYSRPIGAGCDAGSFEFCADNPCGCGRDLPANTWLMTAPPCTPTPTGINAQLGLDLGGTYGTDWISFEWFPATQAYNQQASTDPLLPGVGNWNYSTNAGTMDIDGTATLVTADCSVYGSTGACFAIDLVIPPAGQNRWNLVGHPFPYTVDWADVRIATFNGSAWTADSPSDAETAGFASKTYQIYNGNTYDPYDDSTLGKLGTLQPQEAIWVRSLSGSSSLGAGNFKLLIPAR